MESLKVGVALTGSFCTFDQVIPVIGELVAAGHQVTPIMSEFSYATDTRFGKAADFAAQLEEICGRPVIHTIVDAEPIGPKKLFDVMVIAPCTGNTLSKLASGVTDTCVTMAAKAHLRNQRPLVIAASTNDALGNAAKNIGTLFNYRGVYFVPMSQDNPKGKPRSVVAHFDRIPAAILEAAGGEQIQPVYL